MNIIELIKEDYELISHNLGGFICDDIYIASILNGNGRVFVENESDINSAILWHYYGFGYVVGNTHSPLIIENLLKLLSGTYEKNQRRFILFPTTRQWDEIMIELSQRNSQIHKKQRLMFKFENNFIHTYINMLPKDFELVEIDRLLFDRLKGRVVPSNFWHNSNDFLNHGKGFCIINNDNIVASSISACIGNGKIDIGVETNIEYMGRGFGTLVASKMVEYALQIGYEPDWGCDSTNLGSVAIARKLGFVPIGSHNIYILDKV